MLVAVPLEDQLNDPSSMGLADPNATANCVPTTLAAAGKVLVGWRYSGGDLEYEVYGAAHRGATDPLEYQSFLAQHGVTMTEVRGPADVLVATAKAELAKGHPVYAAIPSAWGIVTAAQVAANPSLPTHAVMLCDASGGNMTAMNPWPVNGATAFYQTNPESWWLQKIVYGHVIVLARSLPVTLTRVDAATVRDDHGTLLHYNVADYALAHHQGANILRPEDYTPLDPAHFTEYALLDDGAVLTYLKSENATREDRGAFVVNALLGRLTAAQAAEKPAPAPATTTSPELGALRAQLQELLNQLPAEPAA